MFLDRTIKIHTQGSIYIFSCALYVRMERLHRQLKKSICYLTCPISCQLFLDPVVCSDGNIYSKAEIQAWWNRCMQKQMPTTSPLTNLPISNTVVYPVRALEDIIKLVETLQKTADTIDKDYERIIVQAVNEATRLTLVNKEVAIKEAVERALFHKEALLREEVEKDKKATCMSFMKLASQYSQEAVKWENAALAAQVEIADIKAQVCAAREEIKSLQARINTVQKVM